MDRYLDHPIQNLEGEDVELDVEVDMNEWGEASSPQVIGTTALGPCIGVIVYDRVNKDAHVGHFTSPALRCADKFLEVLKEKYSDKLGLQVYLGGAAPIPEDGMEEENKESILNNLKKLGFEDDQIYSEWLKPGTNTVMSIDTSTGKVVYDTLSDEDLIDY